MSTALPPERYAEALARITGWRMDPARPVACPVCGAAGLVIIDRSARPYAEWYALNCSACGLDANVHVPLSGPAGS